MLGKLRSSIQRLLNDPHYRDVRYDPEIGGLLAIHVAHLFHPERGHYELEVAEAILKNGDQIILEKEAALPGEVVVEGTKHPDGLYNGLVCEIASITGTSRYAVRRAMQHCQGKGAEVAILHFPISGSFSEERLLTGMALFNGLTDFRFREIVVVYEGGVKKKSHP